MLTNAQVQSVILSPEDEHLRELITCVGRNNPAIVRNGKSIPIARVILNCPPDKVVDHIDSNIYNNVRSNLRICTIQDNVRNRTKSLNKSSKYKGVTFRKNRKHWVASITVNYSLIYLGGFDTEEKAAKAYNVAAVKYFGEFAKLNILQNE